MADSNEESLEKGIKEKLASLATAAAIVGVPYNQAKAPTEMPQIPKVSVTQEQGLRPIAYIESRNGANMRHEKVHHGLNSGTSAIGIYGFMPLQVQDTIKHDDILKQKYGKLLQYHPVKQSSAIEHFLLDHPDAQHELANSHWHRVNSIFHKNKDRAVYAWKYGIHGAAHAPAETIQNDPYVKDYHKYKKMLDVEKPYKGNEPLRPIKKSEKSQVNPKHLKFTYEKMDPKEDMFGNKHTVHEFRVHLKGHGEVGQATVHKYKGGHAHVDYVHVDEDHRGKGIANHLYNHIEQRLKTDLEPSEDQTEQGERLWDKRLNRSEFDLAETLEKALMLNPHVQDVAEGYAKSKGRELTHDLSPVKVNPEHGYMIASAYERMPHNPHDHEVGKAYSSLVNETKDQYKHLLSSGYKFSPIQPGQDNPYKSSKDMLSDVHNNKHLWYYPTDQGFGGEQQHPDHPLLQPTEFTDKHGKPMLANDVFRQVHDVFGHAMYGNGFGPSGEHKAYLAHKQMYSHDAGKALASETMGQNNWVNWNSKFGEQNRRTPQKTVYAEQKAGLLPDHVLNENWHADEVKKSDNTLYHYSNHPEVVGVIDPKHHGTGVVGKERGRPGRLPRSYYYDTPEDHEPIVTEQAKHRYTVQHPGKILDLASDESKHVRDAAKNEYGIIEPDKLEAVIHQKGYNGYKNSAGSYPNIVAVFKPLEIKSHQDLSLGKSETDTLEKAIDPKKGEEDIGKKSLNEIQKDTAEVWASRSIAAYKRFEKTKDPQWKIDAEEYRHEAVEHAALVIDVYPNLIRDISKALEKYRGKTTKELDNVCKSDYPTWIDNKGLIEHLAVTSDIDEAAAASLVGDKVAYRKMFKVGNVTAEDVEVDLKKAEHYADLPTEIRPPIVVDDEGVLVDGYHRYYAALCKGEREIDAYIMVAPEILEKKAKGTGRSYDQITHDALADLQNFRNSPQQYGSVFATGDEPRSTTFGAKPATLYSFGPHWPIARILDNQTIAVNTHPYGGQTKSLVDKVMKELPEYFPAHKIVEVNHPDYLKSAQIMRGGEKAIREHLEDASQNHPDPEAKAKAAEHLKFMGGLKKGTKEKRDAFIGYDPKQNENVRVARLGRYLSSIGLTAAPHLDEEAPAKLMGRDTPTTLTTSPGEGPTEQQLTHEASHAVQTTPGMTLRDYQEAIGQPGTRVHDVQTIGKLPPEVRAQMGEAGVARRAGLTPFRARPGWKDPGTMREVAHGKAKEAQQMLDEGIVRFDPFEGRLEYQNTPNALINIRARGDKDMADEIRRRKYKGDTEKGEEVEKGVKQRLFPFNPAEDVTREDQRKLSLWTDPLETGHTVGRENTPRLIGNGRKRALHSLSSRTKVRWNKDKNEREFLLHRGMSYTEHNGVTDPVTETVNHPHKTSWTPKYNTALTFASNYDTGDKPGIVASAWVPESNIHHVPIQTGAQARVEGAAPITEEGRVLGPFEWRNEYEVIADPGEYDLADPGEVEDPTTKAEALDLETLFKSDFNPAEGVSDFIPMYVSKDNEKESSYIDQMIKMGKTYALPHKGLFTSESFIAGSDPDHAWLIKVESSNRPGIKAVQHTGPQPVKEAAFYEASKLFGLSQFIPQTILGHIRKNGQEKWAVAIKMLPKNWQPMAQVNDDNHGASRGILRKYHITGLSHMLAFMLYVLGDLDSHGNNYMTDGTHIRLIDHGSSFADMRSEDKSDKKMHVPYVLRSEGFKKKMESDQKLSFMPKIATAEALNRVKQHILAIDPKELEQVISSYKLNPGPEITRLKIVQHLVKFSEHPDIILNHLWVSGAPHDLIERYTGEKDGP